MCLRGLVVLATTEANSTENKLVTHYLGLLAQNLAEASVEVSRNLYYAAIKRSKKTARCSKLVTCTPWS